MHNAVVTQAKTPAAPEAGAPEWDLRPEEHMGLVYHLVSEVERRMGDRSRRDELVSAGTLGLMEALRSFDPTRGLAFSTFAVPRIRGAISDELRGADGLPRSFRRKERQMEAARREFLRTHQREPLDHELAGEMGLSLEVFARWQAEVEGFRPVSLDHAPAGYAESGRGNSLAEVLAAQDGTEVEEALSREEEVAYLRDALLSLTERERLVLTLHYYEELNFVEIGQTLNLTRARAWQIHAEVVDKLRRRMRRLRAA